MTDDKLEEALLITQEECAEVIQAISKILRFGTESRWPQETGPTNAEHLEEELGDLLCMMNMLAEENLVRWIGIKTAADQKREKLKKWSKHL